MDIYNPDADLRCDSNPSKNDYARFCLELDYWRQREAGEHGSYFPLNALAYNGLQLQARFQLYGLEMQKVSLGCYLITPPGHPPFKACLVWHGGELGGRQVWVEKPQDYDYDIRRDADPPD